MRRRTLVNTEPNGFYKDSREGMKEMNKFLKKCMACLRGGRDNNCPIFNALADSILDKVVRWEEDWIDIDKQGWPQCKFHEGGKK